MRSFLYFFAVFMVICWLVGFVAFSAGRLIHILLVFAIVAVLLNIIQGRRPLD